MNRVVIVSNVFVIVFFLVAKSQSFVGKSNFLRIGRSIQGTNSFFPSSEIYAAGSPNVKKEGRNLTPAQKAIKKSVGTDLNEFDKVKQVAYGAVDGIQGITRKKDETAKSFVFDGYSDRRKQVPQKNKTSNPVKLSKPKQANVFESVKGVVYGTADVVSSIGKVAAGSEKKTTTEKEKIPVKRAIPQELMESIPDLKSDNPVKRLAAEAKLNNLLLQEEAKLKQKEIQDNIDKVKNTIYAAGDAINETVETAKAVPVKVSKFVEETKDFVESVPGTVQKTVDDITAIPSKIERKAYEVKASFDTTIDKTRKFIEDVKAIPSKIEQSVENTKKSIDNTVKTVEEVKTNTKVLLGLEKPKPKPPKTPPPKPPTAANIALKVAGTVASTLGKGVLWAGKSAVDLSVVAAKKGIEAVQESASRQQAASPKPALPTKAAERKATDKLEVSQTIGKEEEARRNDVINTEDLEKQVAEALRLAEEALEAPKSAGKEVEPEKIVAEELESEKLETEKVETAPQKTKTTKSRKKK